MPGPDRMAVEQDRRISEVVKREQSRLRAFIRRRVSDPRDTEDILQDVFHELVEANRMLMPIEHVTAWLFRVARYGRQHPGSRALSVLETSQADALGMLFLTLLNHGHSVGEIFWGLWLVPFGLLVMRSGFLPRILGILLIVACCGYLVSSLTSLLWPAYGVAMARAVLPALLGEVWIMLWLLFKGIEVGPATAAAS